MSSTCDGVDVVTKNLIRKYRKKLRQIEHLERLNRSLSPDETVKVNSKHGIRELLQEILSQVEEENPVTGEVFDKGDGSPQELQHENYSSLPEEIQGSLQTDEIRIEFVSQETSYSSPQQKETKESSPGKAAKKSDVKVKSKDFATECPAPSATRLQHSEDKSEKKKKKPATQFRVKCLEGHNDLITAVVFHKGIAVTASQDTSVKTWDLTTGTLLKNFGGHTNSVTCVLVLEEGEYRKSIPGLLENGDPFVVSGSFDCTLKVWAMNSGELLKSIYTYNPITQIAYVSSVGLLAVGTDNGNLELWDLDKSEQRFSLHAYDGSVSGLQMSLNHLTLQDIPKEGQDRQLHTCASDGTIRIYSITDDVKLSCIFASENIRSATGGVLTTRHIRSLEMCPRGTLIGDDARNIKVLDWKKNEAAKIPNHHLDYSSTDAMRCRGNLIVASSYDLDTGLGYLNVRSSRTLDYMESLDDKDTERILCVDFGSLPNGDMAIVTGGVELKVWELLKPPQKNSEDIFTAERRKPLASLAVDSEDEDDEDDDEDTDDESDDDIATQRKGPQLDGQSSSWVSWCTLI